MDYRLQQWSCQKSGMKGVGEVGGGTAVKNNIRDPCRGNVLFLDCFNVNILTVIVY